MTINIKLQRDRYEDIYGGYYETHTVWLDGERVLEQSEGIEPEDVSFGRDLVSPLGCKQLLIIVAERSRKGEELSITEITKDYPKT